MSRQHGVLYRYLAGHPLVGEPHDGGYWRRGPGRSAYGRLAGWQRQAAHLTPPAAWIAGHSLYAAHPWYGLAVAATGGVAALRYARGWWRMRRFRRMYIRPTLRALRTALGDAPVELHVDPGLGTLMTRLARPMSPAEKWVRERYGLHVEPVVRWLPDRVQRARWAVRRAVAPAVDPVVAVLRRPAEAPGQRIELRAAVPFLAAEQITMVRAIVGAKLPAGELVESFDQVGPHVTARWTVRKRPPTRCGYADLDARFAGLGEGEFFLGLGADGRPVTIDLHDDAPHIAMSAGSGAGKSVFAQVIAVQVLARGGRVIILDRKGSHKWARGMAGITYCTRPEQMSAALTHAATTADRRNEEAFEQEDGWDPGERWLVVTEEMNATMAQIKAWWERERIKGDPKLAPAIGAFRELLFMGRSAKINVIGIGQMLTALAVGGPEARENFGIRALARYTKNNWQMLVDGVAMPRPSRTLGRWQIVVQGVATETQVCYLTAAEARLFIAKHRGVPVSPVDGGSPLMASDQEMSPGHGPSGDMPADPLAAEITLRRAVDEGVVPGQYAAVKKRLQRARAAEDQACPAPVGRDGTADTYRVGDLIAWAESGLKR